MSIILLGVVVCCIKVIFIDDLHLSHYPRYVQQLIIYGTIDTSNRTNAAHVKYRPSLAETMIPIGTGFVGVPIMMLFTSSDFLIMTVHMLAPIKSKRLPATEKIVETKKVRLFLRIPVSNANAAQIDPSSSIQYAALVD